MKVNKTVYREVRSLLHRQYGVLARTQLSALGIAPTEIRAFLRRGEWEPVGRRVLRATAARPGAMQQLWAAYLAAGPHAVVSHGSAAWLWGLTNSPGPPELTLPLGEGRRVPGAIVHRSGVPFGRISFRGDLPCTSPVRTVSDLAVALSPADLDNVIDVGIASRLFPVEALEAEIARTAGRARQGPARLRAALERRGFISVPGQSVLESRFSRLLARAGIRPIALEPRAGVDGRYRIDTQLSARLFVEVDGYAYHHSPEQKADDERRRNRIRIEGKILLVYTWRDVVDDGGRVINELRQALALHHAG